LANTGNAQRNSIENVKVSLNLQEKSLAHFFKQVESKTDFKFTYTDNLVDLKQPVTVVENNTSLYEVLVAVSRQTHLNFVQVNENIHVKGKKGSSEENTVSIVIKADINVIGTVIDEGGRTYSRGDGFRAWNDHWYSNGPGWEIFSFRAGRVNFGVFLYRLCIPRKSVLEIGLLLM